MTSAVTRSATSSQDSASGRSRFDSQAGETTNTYGQDPALASLSAAEAKARGLLTSGTYGHISTISSSSAALQSSLGSRLRAKLASSGSTLYKLTWKVRATPQLRSIYALRAQALPTSASDYSGWATPVTREHKECGDVSKSFIRKDGRTRSDTLYRQLWIHRFGLHGKATREQIADLECCHVTLSRMLMGIPAEWDACVPTETLLCLKSRSNSFSPTCLAQESDV